jgi:hypothetical protein
MTLKNFCQYVIKEQPKPITLKPLTIATPFYYSFHFLEQYLTALQKLDYPKELLTLCWAVQGNDDTYAILNDFKERMKHRYHDIILERRGELTEGKTGLLRANLNICDQRNWLKKQTKSDVLFIGHDNFPPPQTIKKLLEAQTLGADIAGGVYPFAKNDELGFTSFFLMNMAKPKDGLHKYPVTALVAYKDKTWFPQCLYNKRCWTWTVGMDCTLIKHEVLDKIDYAITLAPAITDDVEFCHKARLNGFYVLTDYGLWCPHWGFKTQFLTDVVWNGYIQVICLRSPELRTRRIMFDEMRRQQVLSKNLVIAPPI